MVDSWTISLICTKRADGTFSLRLFGYGSDGSDSPAGITRIRSPAQLVEALGSMMSEIAGHDLSDNELKRICDELATLDAQFSKNVGQEILNRRSS